MNSYVFEKRDDRPINKKEREKTIQVYKKDEKTQITPEELQKLNNALTEQSKKSGKKYKIMIRGFSNTGAWTLKGFNTDLDVNDEERYFEGKVRDPTSLAGFNQLQITIIYEI